MIEEEEALLYLGLPRLREEGTYVEPITGIHFYVERRVVGGWVVVPPHLPELTYPLKHPDYCSTPESRWKIPFDMDLFGMLAPAAYNGFKRKYPAIKERPYKPSKSPSIWNATQNNYPYMLPSQLRLRSSIRLHHLLDKESELRVCNEYFVDIVMKEMLKAEPFGKAKNIRAVFWFE